MRQEHIDFFNTTLNRLKDSLNIVIPITPYDHSLIKGHKNALGICHGYKDKTGWEPEKITIDEYFIEECYEAEINGNRHISVLIEGRTLISVICHEIAHIQEWRHGKKHRNLTQHLINLVESKQTEGIAA